MADAVAGEVTDAATGEVDEATSEETTILGACAKWAPYLMDK